MICFAANIAFITLELAHVTLVWAFAAVSKLVSGKVATLHTEVLALVTQLNGHSPLWKGIYSNNLPSKNRSRSQSTIFEMMTFDG